MMSYGQHRCQFDHTRAALSLFGLEMKHEVNSNIYGNISGTLGDMVDRPPNGLHALLNKFSSASGGTAAQ
jgi:hypothetical protein